MNDFETRFREALKPYERAHVTLQEYSRHGVAEIGELGLVEPASFGLLLKNASDTHGAERRVLSASAKRAAEDVLSPDCIVLSAIGMSRYDIAPLETVNRGMAGSYTFKMAKNNGFIAPAINHDADQEFRFDRAEWEGKRFAALDCALSHGAQIISFGETDYSPVDDPREQKEYQTKLQAKIDAVDRPVFLVAGTRYDHEPEGCLNCARILTNRALRSIQRLDLGDGPILHRKLFAAQHTGERISVPVRPRVVFYETVLGKIAVLICVDAYSPTVVMSLLANMASRGRDQVEYILVPSYNNSPKLFYSCQVLSLLTGSVVMLVDACSEPPEKPAQTAIFIHGRLISDLLNEDYDDELGRCGEFVSEEPHRPVRSCKISMDYLREAKSRDSAATPFFNQVGRLFMSTKLRGM